MFTSVDGNYKDLVLEKKKEEQITTDIYYLKRSGVTNCKNILNTERQTRQSPWDSEAMCPV